MIDPCSRDPRESVRALIVALSTYSSAFNDGKLRELAPRVAKVVAATGDVDNLWGSADPARRESGYEVLVLKTHLKKSNATASLEGLRAVADAIQPTVIHAECEPWQAVAAQSLFLGKQLRVPIGIQFAENGPMFAGKAGQVRRAVARWILRRCDYAIGWSSGSSAVALQLAPGLRVETAPGTGVSLSHPVAVTRSGDLWFPGGNGTPKLAFVGRFVPEKGFRDFLVIADKVAAQLPCSVALAGGDPSNPELCVWLSSRPWARCYGVLAREAVKEMLSVADILVCPSRTTPYVREQFGKAAVEAMSVGTPVFAFDCGALREVIGDGGVVVPEGATKQLAEEIVRFLSGAEKPRQLLRERARRRAAEFADSVLADQLARLWAETVCGHEGRGAEGRSSRACAHRS